jgi:tetratricopeptide (TPR) repeat protein
MEDNQNSFDELISLANEAENVGNFQKMVHYLNLSLQHADDKRPILERLLSYHLNDVNPSKAMKILKDLMIIEPANPTYYKQAVSILLELGKGEYAQKLAKIAYNNTKDPYFEEIFKSNNEVVIIEPEISSDVIPLLFTLFSGREGVYARQWKNSEGQVGYVPVYEPLNEIFIINHLNGNTTIGIYQHRLDSTVTWICFDIDIAKHVLNNALQNDNYFKELDYATHRTAAEIYEEAARHNILVYIEHSGYKGRHCWIFLSKPVPARIAKRFGDVLKSNLKTITPEISVLLFPKQNFV